FCNSARGSSRSAIAAASSAIALGGIGAVAHDWTIVLVLIGIGGIGNAFAQVGGNLALAAGVGHARQGLAFGIKQSAVPTSSLLSGLAVPVIALTVGWRWSYALAFALAPILAALLVRRLPLVPSRSPAGPAVPIRWPMLVAIAVAYGGASGTSATLSAFVVGSAVHHGIAIGVAGTMLAAGSLVSISVRLAVGWIVDRRGRTGFGVISVLLLIGSIGYAAMASGGSAIFVIGCVIAFGAGWGWNGAFNHAVVSMNPRNPGSATGMTMIGMAVGGVVWPLVFGQIVERVGYGAAWSASAGVALTSSAILASCVRRMREGDSRDPPAITDEIGDGPVRRARGSRRARSARRVR
ncbi:MAG: MFS transporter, partial [Burkholderiales bacterium]|nr:MFS transporter [Burkholderiales bacterium]